MNPSENNDQNELQSKILKSIADGIAGISNHLERLTAAVEGVAESIENAHEPEGDLAVHLVSSIKDLTSVLRSRIQHERGNQPQHAQRSQILTPQSQNRRNDGHQSDRQSRPQDQYSRNEHARDGDHNRTEGPRDVDPSAHPEKLEDKPDSATTAQTDVPSGAESPLADSKHPRPNVRRRRGSNGRRKPASTGP